jgi:hypothetical protein
MAEPGGFTFGGNTGLTYEALKHRRAIAAALAAKRMKLPTTVGEGMTYFGESLADAAGTLALNQKEQTYAAQQQALQRSLAEDPEALRLPGEGGPAISPGLAAAPAPAPAMVTSPASLETPNAGGGGGSYDNGETVFDTAGAPPTGQPLPPNPPVVSDIRPSPVAPGGAPAFPPVAPPSTPPALVDRVPIPPGSIGTAEPTPPVMPPMGPRERKAFSIMNSTDDPHTRSVAKAVMDQEAQRRLDAHAREVKRYDAQIQLHNAKQLQLQKAGIDQPETELKLREKERELHDKAEASALKNRLGGRDPEKFFTEMDKAKESNSQVANTLSQAALARSAINAGVITGFGANQRIDAQRLQAWALGNGMSGNLASNTEQMNAAIKSMLSVAIQNIQGGDSRVTDADIKVASGTVGADPTLQLETIKKLISNNERIAREKLNDYEDRRDYYLKGTRAERAYHIPVPPTADPRYVDALLKNKDNNADRAEFDRRFGAGAAALEIARAKRRER